MLGMYLILFVSKVDFLLILLSILFKAHIYQNDLFFPTL